MTTTQTDGSAAPSDVAADRQFPAEVRRYHEAILHRLDWPGNGSSDKLRTLGVTSCSRGEGVSTLAAGLAATAAVLGDARVLLIDANFAAPAAHATETEDG